MVHTINVEVTLSRHYNKVSLSLNDEPIAALVASEEFHREVSSLFAALERECRLELDKIDVKNGVGL